MSRPLLATTVAATLLATAPSAQDPFTYAINETGQTSVNGTKLDGLPSKFNPSQASGGKPEQRFWDMFVDGADRYALRLDGRVFLNGDELYQLDDASGTAWIALAVDGAGDVYALRTDGRVARNGEPLVDLPNETFACDLTNGNDAEFVYVDLETDGTSTYALRSDGNVYRDTTISPIFSFDGKAGLVDDCDDEGESPDTEWRVLAVDPADGTLFGLRTDGSVVSGDPDDGGAPLGGTIVAELPFGDTISFDRYFRDIEFSGDGHWYALRADGDLYDVDNLVDELVDFAGAPVNDFDQTYMDLRARAGGGVLALRFDGRVYTDADADEPLLKLKGGRFRRLATSDVTPDLTHVDNERPYVAAYKVKHVQGDAVSIPLVVLDREQPVEDLVITVDESKMPAWLEYDAATRTFRSTTEHPTIPTEIDGDSTKGGVKVKYEVDDGGKKPAKGKLVIKVLEPDEKPDKNKKPTPAKIKKAVAFVGLPFELRMIASDRDGDDLTITVDEEDLPVGATFDGVDTITWDAPTIDDLGKVKFTFFVDDGSGKKPKKSKVVVKVEGSFLAF